MLAGIKLRSAKVGDLANNQVRTRRDPEVSADGNSTRAISEVLDLLYQAGYLTCAVRGTVCYKDLVYLSLKCQGF
jgi:hypothetical protein